MKNVLFLSAIFIFAFSVLQSCSDTATTSTNSNDTKFSIPIWDYSESCYLLDSTYCNAFIDYHRDGTSYLQIIKVEVFIHADSNEAGALHILGYTDPPQRPDTGYGDPTAADSLGSVMTGWYKKLPESDYKLSDLGGCIMLSNSSLLGPTGELLASYTVKINNNDIKQYGDYTGGIPSPGKMISKTLRYRFQVDPRTNPAFTKLWSLMLKNIYSLGVTNIANNSSKLNIKVTKHLESETRLERYWGNTVSPNWASNKGYLYLSSIDRYTNSNHYDTVMFGGGDGVFDFFPAITIDLEYGLIIFRSLKPFSSEMERLGVHPDSLGYNDSIYYMSKSRIGTLPFNYYIEGSVTP